MSNRLTHPLVPAACAGNPVAANYAQMLVLQKVPDATSV